MCKWANGGGGTHQRLHHIGREQLHLAQVAPPRVVVGDFHDDQRAALAVAPRQENAVGGERARNVGLRNVTQAQHVRAPAAVVQQHLVGGVHCARRAPAAQGVVGWSWLVKRWLGG